MKLNKFIFFSVLLCMFLLIGCSTMSTRRESLRNYTINNIQQTNVGDAIISMKDITYIEGKRWVGILNSPDGWQYYKYATDDSFQEELIYTGHSGKTINVSYREYKKDFARPAFYQDLKYDLEDTNVIVFRYYKIKVLDATNEYIRFQVLADGKPK